MNIRTAKNEYQDCYLVSMSVVPTESSVCAVYTSEHGDNKIQKSAIVNECAFDQESRWEYFYQKDYSSHCELSRIPSFETFLQGGEEDHGRVARARRKPLPLSSLPSTIELHTLTHSPYHIHRVLYHHLHFNISLACILSSPPSLRPAHPPVQRHQAPVHHFGFVEH